MWLHGDGIAGEWQRFAFIIRVDWHLTIAQCARDYGIHHGCTFRIIGQGAPMIITDNNHAQMPLHRADLCVYR